MNGQKVYLKAYIEQIRGISYKPEDTSNEPVGGYFPVLRANNIKDNNLIFDDLVYVNVKKIKKEQEIRKGDIIVCTSSGSKDLVGKAAQAKKDLQMSFGAFCRGIRPKNILPEYLGNYFKSPIYRKTISKLSAGANINNIKSEHLDNLEIPLPTMEEQKKIAARLDAVSDLLAKQKQLLAEQDTLIQSTFYDMFGNPIKNEKGWKIEKLSSVSDSRLGKMLDAKKQNEANQYPYLANYNVQWFCFNLSDVRKMSFDHNEKCEFELKKGDVLVCEGGDVGRCAIWKEQIQECYFQKALHRVRCNPNFLNPIFLMHLFYNISICNGFEKIVGNKATIAHLTGVKLKALEIPVPPLELQRKFAAVAEQIESEKSKIKSAIAETQTLFNAMMSEYFEE